MLEVFCINPLDYSMIPANEGEVIELLGGMALAAGAAGIMAL